MKKRKRKRAMDIEKIIRAVLSDGKETPCIFDRIVEQIEKWNDTPAHNYTEMRQRENKQIKGLAWEQFCQWYLLKVKKYDQVWLWKEIPEDVSETLNLKFRVDNGIDIIAKRFSNSSNYVAVQCKFKKRQIAKGRKSVKVSWKTLSTFVGLVSRLPRLEQHIVMTNCHGVGKWQIPRTPKDKTIAYGTFKNLTRVDCSNDGSSISSSSSTPLSSVSSVSLRLPPIILPQIKLPQIKEKSIEEIRAARLAVFEKKEE